MSLPNKGHLYITSCHKGTISNREANAFREMEESMSSSTHRVMYILGIYNLYSSIHNFNANKRLNSTCTDATSEGQ